MEALPLQVPEQIAADKAGDVLAALHQSLTMWHPLAGADVPGRLSPVGFRLTAKRSDLLEHRKV